MPDFDLNQHDNLQYHNLQYYFNLMRQPLLQITLMLKETSKNWSLLQNRQRPAFPGGRPPSIIGAEELNFCVRDGYRCDLFAVVTGFIP